MVRHAVWDKYGVPVVILLALRCCYCYLEAADLKEPPDVVEQRMRIYIRRTCLSTDLLTILV